MRRIAALLVLSCAALPAHAADDVLQLRSGGIAVGEIVSTDDRGVTLRTDKGEARYDWEALTPLCAYEVRSALLAPGTAEERIALADFCLRHGLYPYARREVATARGLAPPKPSLLDELSAAIDEAEAEEAFGRIEGLVAEGEFDRAIEEIRRFLIQAPPSPHTERARAMVPDLLRRKDAQALREEEDAKERAEAEKQQKLSERLEKMMAEAAAALQQAATSFAEALRYHGLGNVTRAKDAYLATEGALLDAHAVLRKVQRTVREGVVAEKAEREKDAIRARLIEVYLGLARLYLADRNYKSGIVFVNRALYLDPVNREALDMRREVTENRIHRSVRSLTNQPPIESSR